jgi:4-hydroxyphenylpyruvate dioxygenase
VAASILYDRDDNANISRYTAAPTGKVSSSKSSKGAGAMNAPFRIAAQRRLAPPVGMPKE